MSFFDSPLGERLQDSLKAGMPDDIAAAVDEVEARVWQGKLTPRRVWEILQEQA